jgi:predicted amidohydrolase YtcJ
VGVFCDNAMEVVMSVWPQPDKAAGKKFIKSAMAKLNEVGLVGVHDAGATPRTLELFKELAGGEDWTVRVYTMVECYERNSVCSDKVEKFVSKDGFLSIVSVKLFAGKIVLVKCNTLC